MNRITFNLCKGLDMVEILESNGDTIFYGNVSDLYNLDTIQNLFRDLNFKVNVDLQSVKEFDPDNIYGQHDEREDY